MLRKTLIAAAIVALTPAFAMAAPAAMTAKPATTIHAVKAEKAMHAKHHKKLVHHNVRTHLRAHKAKTTKA